MPNLFVYIKGRSRLSFLYYWHILFFFIKYNSGITLYIRPRNITTAASVFRIRNCPRRLNPRVKEQGWLIRKGGWGESGRQVAKLYYFYSRLFHRGSKGCLNPSFSPPLEWVKLIHFSTFVDFVKRTESFRHWTNSVRYYRLR